MTVFVQIDPQDYNRIIGVFDCPQPALDNVYEINRSLLDNINNPCYNPTTQTVTEHPVATAEQVPVSISPRQARLILLQNNLLAQVENIVASAPESIRIEWEYAIDIRRDSPLVESFASQLGLTKEQLDNMFRAAALL